MGTQYTIYADGVVTTENGDDACVLSSPKANPARKGDYNLCAYRTIWGKWYPDAFRDIRLNLLINGQEILEGDCDRNPAFIELARKIVKRRRSLSGYIQIALFNFSAAHAHLRTLLREYVRLTTVAGPEIPFDTSPVVSIPFPECYVSLDAFMVSMRAYADSLRFLIWAVLGRKTGIPRNLRKLARAQLPVKLTNVITQYVDSSLSDLSEYRDNAVHYAPPGSHMLPLLLLSHGVVHAQVWLPENPEARSLKGFKYLQRDAFTYARELLGQAHDFSNELFPILDQVHREDLRLARKKRQKERNINNSM